MAAENLVKNPGFENWTGESPDSWTAADGAIQKAEGNDVHSGSFALILGDFNNNVRVYQDVGVGPRRMYRFSSWQKYPGPSSSTQVSVVWMDEARKSISAWNKNTFDNSQFSTDYKLFSYDSLTAPPGSAFARIEFIKPGWGLLYADDVAFTLMPRPPIADFTLPPQVRVGQTVEFASSSSVPDGGNITSAVWNFCGAQDLPGTKVTYTFPLGGARDCQVKLTVTSSDGLTNTTTKLVTLEGSSPPGGGPSAAPPSEGPSSGNTPPMAS
ncbi:MAG: PKD domain-containing protein, partial [Methanomicrobiales archaeon]|nr:PKD domain-containing protein [Methanomicrobiales archaeon]